MNLKLFSPSTIVLVAAWCAATMDAQAAAARAPVIGCAPSDAFADAFRTWAVGVATGTDSTSETERQAIGIPVLPDTAIVFVTDSATCDAAARYHAIQARQDTVTPPPVHLLRLGSYRYVAFNGAPAGEFFKYFVFDQMFNFKLAYAM